jgi:hypothetical protein
MAISNAFKFANNILTNGGYDAADLVGAVGGGGITEADVMKVTASQNISSGTYTTVTPFVRSPEATHNKVGTGMTVSSGIFTFPSTGIYLVFLNSSFSNNGDVTYTINQIQVTTNNSTYATVAESNFSIKQVSGQTYYTTTNFIFFDVQDTTNYKLRVQVYGTQDFRMDADTKLYFLKLAET